ncbi:hypothetical protein L9F63_011299, partial [Diploptera punctata]
QCLHAQSCKREVMNGENCYSARTVGLYKTWRRISKLHINKTLANVVSIVTNFPDLISERNLYLESGFKCYVVLYYFRQRTWFIVSVCLLISAAGIIFCIVFLVTFINFVKMVYLKIEIDPLMAAMAILERSTLSKSKEFQNLAKNPGIVPLAPIINPVTIILSNCQLPQCGAERFSVIFQTDKSQGRVQGFHALCDNVYRRSRGRQPRIHKIPQMPQSVKELNRK